MDLILLQGMLNNSFNFSSEELLQVHTLSVGFCVTLQLSVRRRCCGGMLP